MLGWVVRGLLIVSGLVASWFVAHDALNFEFVRGVVAILLFTLAVVLVTLGPGVLRRIGDLWRRKTAPPRE